MRILLVEDDRSLSRAVSTILQKNNYSVDCVENGQMALDYLEKDISGKILYLASLFKGIKDHLKILNEMDELTGVESQMFTILNDLQLGINELCILYEKIEKLEK